MEKNNLKPAQQDLAAAPQQPAGAQSGEIEIDLVELFYRMLESVQYIIIAALIGAIISFLFTSFIIKPKYQATAKLYVLNSSNSVINLQDLQIGTSLASDYTEVFKNWHVHEKVIERLNLPYTYNTIASKINVNVPTGTRVLYITATADSPDEAKAITDTYADVAREFIATTMDTKEPNTFQEALRPTTPSSPNKSRNTALGFILGALLAMGIITLRYITDDKLHSTDDVEK